MSEHRSLSFFARFQLYFTRENLSIALLGFSSGLPIMMTLSTLTYWLSVYGVDKKTIGLASLLGLPYVFKFLWAPLLDIYQLPMLARLGRRKSWIVFFQFLLVLIFIALIFINPRESPYLTGLIIFLLAFASASQDIVIDAYRIDYLSAEAQSYGSSSSFMMYRIAMLFMGAGVLALSDIIPWTQIFLIVALLFGVILGLTLCIQEPTSERSFQKYEREFGKGFVRFFSQENAVLILIFVICYKLPDAVSGVMVTNFYHEMGYSGTQIGTVTKIYGLIATMIGAFLAAGIINFLGIYRSLIISCVLIGLTNLGYLLILYNPNIEMLMLAISAENFIVGFSSALFIMFLSLLCDRDSSATQYALLSALAAFGVRVIGGSSGYLVEYLDWEWFFIVTAFLFVPALFLLIFLRQEIEIIGKKDIKMTAR